LLPEADKSGERAVNLRRSLDTVTFASLAATAASHDRDILNQDAFHRVISLERRRTERSRKPFVLMLLDMGDHLPSEATGKSLSKLLTAVSACTRATDVAGWYKQDSVVGVMFTEIAIEDRRTIVSTMISRVSDMLKNQLTLDQFNRVSVSFHVFPEDWEQESQKPSNPIFYPDLVRKAERKRVSGAVKRGVDIIGSVMTLVCAFPFFVAIAAAIKATSKGPVFFRQRRIGQHGRPFVFLKFRSMYVGNNPGIHKQYVQQLIAGKAERHQSNGNGRGVFKLTKDPRITKIGSFLRRTSLDELPQFINVLKGEMSLVGPRPPVPYEVEAYDLWHRSRLLEAKPGITGLWQVSGRSRVTFDEMVRLDLRYARCWTPWLDLQILLRTPGAVLLGEGAH
jgi:lipopolysaccharide/colanic/teichoic acid biosynthesis glycosyltransferase